MIESLTNHYALRNTRGNKQQQRHMDALAKGYECVGDTAFDIDLHTFTISKRSTKTLYQGQQDGGEVKVYYTRNGRDNGAKSERRILDKSSHSVQHHSKNFAKAC